MHRIPQNSGSRGNAFEVEDLANSLHNQVEPGRIGNRHLRQRPPIEFDASLFQACYELRVTQSPFSNSRTDADDPEATELTLATTTVAMREDARPDERFFGCSQQLAATADVSFDTLKQTLFGVMAGDSTLCTHDGGFR
jgi:hypothetical protein